jgi:hypothetical protein
MISQYQRDQEFVAKIDALKSVLTPPIQPTYTGTPESWRQVERQLGYILPHDYKLYIDTFGEGSVDGYVIIFDPFSVNGVSNYPAYPEAILEVYRSEYMSTDWKIEVYGKVKNQKSMVKYWPEKGGLLPFGMTNNGDFLFWRTNGPPDQWTIVINRRSHSDRLIEFDMNLVEFLTRFVRKEFDDLKLSPFEPVFVQ